MVRERCDELVPDGGPGNAARPDQQCPVEVALAAVSGRWTTLILRDLARGPLTYGELAAGLPTLSDKVLSERLASMVRGGLVEREVVGSFPRRTRYALSAVGVELRPLLVELYATGRRLQLATAPAVAR
jgi:DNA-binding HxlR family transcriptional regulator